MTQATEPQIITPKPPRDNTARFTALRGLLGRRITLQERGGVIISGKFTEFIDKEGYLRLEDATITGKRKQAKPTFVLVHFSIIAHIHDEVEPVDLFGLI